MRHINKEDFCYYMNSLKHDVRNQQLIDKSYMSCLPYSSPFALATLLQDVMNDSEGLIPYFMYETDFGLYGDEIVSNLDDLYQKLVGAQNAYC